ncbi:hypothetical protein HF680_15235 [Brevundimonas sp. WCHBH090558]|uniref:hypothetical protein n=1 Tax=Brevundimonas huaxiensis TaxID=2725493 RepID=UPI001628FCEB|nr:hypothetical protein [Brevundimonas huaxiensis]MBC1183995.1 hypothetical protein [Brevundimonas huaxiensis]
MKTKIGYYIEERKRSDGRSRLRFVVPERLRPVGWPKSRPLFLEGQDGIDMAQLAPEEEVELRRQADILYTDLCKARAGVGYANADPVQPAGIQKASLETWRTVIALRRSSEKWHGNSTRTQDNYELLQQRLVIMSEGMGLDLATSPQSEFERALMLEVSSKYSRRELYRELRALASMAIREGLRPAHLVITSTARPPKAKIQLWKEADVYCLVTEMLRNNEEGLAKFILTQWEIGQRISVRRQRLWHRSGVADNGGIGSRRSDVRNADETQSLQPKIGCQAHQEARRGGGERYSPCHTPAFLGRG